MRTIINREPLGKICGNDTFCRLLETRTTSNVCIYLWISVFSTAGLLKNATHVTNGFPSGTKISSPCLVSSETQPSTGVVMRALRPTISISNRPELRSRHTTARRTAAANANRNHKEYWGKPSFFSDKYWLMWLVQNRIFLLQVSLNFDVLHPCIILHFLRKLINCCLIMFLN